MVDRFVLRTDPVAYMCPNDHGPWVLHEDYEKLRAAVVTLRRAQRAYLAERGNEELGAAVARAAAYVDEELLRD